MPVTWLNFIQGVALAGAGFLLFSIRQAFKGGQWSTELENRLNTLESKHKEQREYIEKRFELAGVKMSDVATDVQSLPERLRREFVTREVMRLETLHFKDDVKRIERDIAELFRIHRP